MVPMPIRTAALRATSVLRATRALTSAVRLLHVQRVLSAWLELQRAQAARRARTAPLEKAAAQFAPPVTVAWTVPMHLVRVPQDHMPFKGAPPAHRAMPDFGLNLRAMSALDVRRVTHARTQHRHPPRVSRGRGLVDSLLAARNVQRVITVRVLKR